MTLEETWKDIEGYEELYQVSNLGRVKSLRNDKLLKQFVNRQGYSQVSLSKNGKVKLCRVNRIVCRAFIENPENKAQVNHIDGNKLNNRVDNLEWCTGSENVKHAYINGLQKPIRGKDNILSKQVFQYNSDKKLIKIWGSVGEIQRELGIAKQLISACCLGKTNTCRGYIWRY